MVSRWGGNKAGETFMGTLATPGSGPHTAVKTCCSTPCVPGPVEGRPGMGVAAGPGRPGLWWVTVRIMEIQAVLASVSRCHQAAQCVGMTDATDCCVR